MPQESDGERADRIRDAQINDRGAPKTLKPRPGAKAGGKPSAKANARASARAVALSNATAKVKKNAIVQPIKKAISVNRANTTANAIHDIVVGVGISAIVALLALVFLPGGFKLVSIAILLVGGVAGYMLGETVA